MKIFLAGATGAVGQALIPLLTSHGHTVTGTTRSPSKADAAARARRRAGGGRRPRPRRRARRRGRRPPRRDHPPDDRARRRPRPAQVRALVRRHQPPAHRGHRPPARGRPRDGRRALHRAELRAPGPTRGSAARSRPRTTRSTRDPPKQVRTTLDAIRHLEAAVTGAGGIALRYGGFYGPGTGFAPGGEQWEMIKARKFPIVGDGGGVFSFAHIEDVAGGDARRARARHAGPHLQHRRRRAGAGPRVAAGDRRGDRRAAAAPRPALGRPLMGEHVVVMMCEIRGASNERAKRELGWEPRWPTWREGIPALARPRRRSYADAMRPALLVAAVLLAAGGGYALGAAGGDDAPAIERYVVPGSTDDDPTVDKWVTAECPKGSTVVSGGAVVPHGERHAGRRRLLVGALRGPRRSGLVGRGAGHAPRQPALVAPGAGDLPAPASRTRAAAHCRPRCSSPRARPA